MDYKFKWRAEANTFTNKVCMTGIIIENKQGPLGLQLLFQNALDMIEIAEYFGGIIIPSNPPQRDEESIYFEIIFKDDIDRTDFLKELTKGFS